MSQKKLIKDNKDPTPKENQAILKALKYFYPEFYKTLLDFARKKFKLENYKK